MALRTEVVESGKEAEDEEAERQHDEHDNVGGLHQQNQFQSCDGTRLKNLPPRYRCLRRAAAPAAPASPPRPRRLVRPTAYSQEVILRGPGRCVKWRGPGGLGRAGMCSSGGSGRGGKGSPGALGAVGCVAVARGLRALLRVLPRRVGVSV